MNKNVFSSGACARAGLGLPSALMIVLAARAIAPAIGCQQQRTVDFIYPEP